MVFGRKKKNTGPAGTYAGANPRYNGGVVDDGVVEEQSRCCCFKMARAGLMTMTLICLAIIFGLSVAALVGGYRKYMFYRKDTIPTANGPFQFRTWIGWYKYANTTTAGKYVALKSLSMGAYILGLIVAGFLGGSALLALLFMLFTCCGRSRSLACIALPGSFLMFGVLVVFYVASAIKYDRSFRQQTGGAIPGKHIPWPSWAWCLGIAASLLWLLVSIFMLGTPSRTVMKPSKRVYDAEAAQPGGVRQAEPIVVGSKAPTRTYGAPQTVAAPEGASLGTVAPAPVPVNTSKFGRFRKTGKPVASAVVPGGENTTLFSTPPLASTETAAAPSYAPNYGGVAPMQSSDVVEGGNDNLGKGAWASKGGVVGGNGNTVV